MFKKTLIHFTLVFSFFLINTTLQAAEDVKIKTIPVADNIFMLTGKGGNIGLFTGDDGTFIIDDQFAPLTQKILKAVKAAGGETPRFLINTHFHGDHTGGNENLGKEGALIVAHDNVRVRMLSGAFIKAFGVKISPAEKEALPVMTFSKDMQFHINNESVKAIHAPAAHTDGDSFIHFKNANVIHADDTFFNGFYPFIDADHGGSLPGMIKATDAMLAITDSYSKIIPGHGPLADRNDLQAYRDMLNTAYNRLLKLKNEGVSVEDAIIKAPLEDLEAQWGGGIFKGEKWISIVYPAVY